MKQKHSLRLIYSRDAANTTASYLNTTTAIGGLHPAIQDLITRHQLLLAPVCTHSRYATLKPLCHPTNDLDVLASVASENCNWVVRMGSSLIVTEINLEIGRELLACLSANESKGWSDTLQFGDKTSRFLFFLRPEQRLRFFGNRVRGIKVHAGDSALLQIPPSWFVSEAPLKWVDPHARILDAPTWMLEDELDAA